MKVVIDTNIIFSTLLNSKTTLGDLIFNSDEVFEFYSSSYMRQEIDRHWDKLKKLSKLSDEQLNESCFRVFSKIQFLNEELIPEKTWVKAEETVRNIDIDDTDFVALTIYLKGTLWTGDKVLYNGLKNLKFRYVRNSAELLEIRSLKVKPKNK